MRSFPDISEWYTPQRIDSEEPLWGASKSYRIAIAEVMRSCTSFGLKSVVEVGCGTAWIPTELPKHITYVGVDKSPHMLARARAKNPGVTFHQCDVREIETLGLKPDLVFSLGVLKHFSLWEWDYILKKILSLAPYGLFTQHALMGDVREAFEDGMEYHHIWPTESEVLKAVDDAGHEIIWRDCTRFDEVVKHPECSIWTKRKGL